MEQAFADIDAGYDALYADLLGPGAPRIVNFGENVAMACLSTDYFERYVLPWYEQRSGQLRRAGLPAVLFLDHYPIEALRECAGKLAAWFHPRLVLGISDEFPQGAGPKGFEKLKWLAAWCRTRPAG